MAAPAVLGSRWRCVRRHCDVTGLPPSTCPCGACWDEEDETQDGSDDEEAPASLDVRLAGASSCGQSLFPSRQEDQLRAACMDRFAVPVTEDVPH